MRGHGAKFGRKKEAAIVALLTHRTTEEAARAFGIGTATLLRWMKDPEFDTAYRAAKRAAFAQSIARLHHLSSAAVSTLGKVMLDPATPPATRVRAADSILDHTTKAIEQKTSRLVWRRWNNLLRKLTRGDENDHQESFEAGGAIGCAAK